MKIIESPFGFDPRNAIHNPKKELFSRFNADVLPIFFLSHYLHVDFPIIFHVIFQNNLVELLGLIFFPTDS